MDQLDYSAIDRETRAHLDDVKRLKSHLEDAEQAHSLKLAEMLADRTRERGEWAAERQRLAKRADELSNNVGRKTDELDAARRTIDTFKPIEARAKLLLTAVEQGSDREVGEAAKDLRSVLK